MYVDLHIHSTASDGTLTPSQIVKFALSKNISVISITDHDTISGIEEARLASLNCGLYFIPGVEVTADTRIFGKGSREFHILGYYIDPSSPSMKHMTSFSRESRKKRNEELISKLSDVGVSINYDDMVKRFGENFGKPNIATKLVEDGVCAGREEAFSLLKKFKVYRRKLDYREIVHLIKDSGGIAVVAHPVSLRMDFREFYRFLLKAKENGVDGVEVYHPTHTSSQIRILKEMACELKMLYTGGSDFHGDNKPCVDLGMLGITMSDISFPLHAVHSEMVVALR